MPRIRGVLPQNPRSCSHETLGNISHLPPHIIDLVRRALKGESLVNPEAAFTCLRSFPHGHVAAVLGSLNKLDLHSLIARPHSRMRDLVVAMIVARVIDARSKLATARALNPESAVSTLGQMLNLDAVDENELYQAMDWLRRRQWGIEKRLAKRHLSDNTLMLYDLTSSYFEGHCCPLAQRGHSRDGKRGTLQIVFGLLCTAAGCPVAVEVFEGSTSVSIRSTRGGPLDTAGPVCYYMRCGRILAGCEWLHGGVPRPDSGAAA